jgi:hypothetical protein
LVVRGQHAEFTLPIEDASLFRRSQISQQRVIMSYQRAA